MRQLSPASDVVTRLQTLRLTTLRRQLSPAPLICVVPPAEDDRQLQEVACMQRQISPDSMLCVVPERKAEEDDGQLQEGAWMQKQSSPDSLTCAVQEDDRQLWEGSWMQRQISLPAERMSRTTSKSCNPPSRQVSEPVMAMSTRVKKWFGGFLQKPDRGGHGGDASKPYTRTLGDVSMACWNRAIVGGTVGLSRNVEAS